MKQIFLSISVLAFAPVWCQTNGYQSQGQSQNLVVANQVQKKGVKTSDEVASLPVKDNHQLIQYFDGLGRPVQVITTQGSPSQKDLVQFTKYDEMGRESIKYLPFTSTDENGWFKADVQATQAAFYSNGTDDKIIDDPKPFSETVYEKSPLGRVQKQGSPGVTWQPDNDPNSLTDHTVKSHFEFNQSGDVVQFTYDATSGLVSAGDNLQIRFYQAGELNAKRTTDEHQNDVIEYTDKQGKTICRKVQNGNNSNVKLFACTYYVYDDMNNLVVVLTPEAVNKIVRQVNSD